MGAKRHRIKKQLQLAQKQHKVVSPKYLAACYGKIRHSKDSAKVELEKNPYVNMYKCEFCPYYHVGRKL